MPPKKKPGTALVKWEEKFANMAKEAAKKIEVSDGKFISFKGGRMTFGGADIPDNELRCVIIGWLYHNTYYDPNVRYDPENPQSPLCYAYGDDEKTMAPMEEAPEIQSDQCKGCPLNEWESGSGKAKACKNGVKLALISEDDLENIDEAEVVYANVPPTSIANFKIFAKKKVMETAKRPIWAVITKITCDVDSKSSFKVNFELEDAVEDGNLFDPLEELAEKTVSEMATPYVVREVEQPVKRGKGKAVAKPAAKKFGKR